MSIPKGTPQYYCSLDYYSPQRLGQYYYQIKSVREAGAKKVLEIGPGPGVVTHILRKAGLDVVTCDCASELSPDLCGDIRSLPVGDNTFDFSLCCQVLEHLPYEDFGSALAELRRVTCGQILISIPYAARVIYALHKLPGGRRNSWVIHFPWLPRKKDMVAGHFWEMGRKGFPKRRIKKSIEAAGLKILRDFVPVDAPHNQYFLLKKLL